MHVACINLNNDKEKKACPIIRNFFLDRKEDDTMKKKTFERKKN